MIPTIVIGMFVPLLLKGRDKFKVYYIGTAAGLVVNIVRWFIGYSSIPAYLAITLAAALPAGVTSILVYMFTPDCAEYGHYITGKSYPGITFAVQTFFAKLQSAVLSTMSAICLVFTGFVEGENAVQPEGFADTLWNWSCALPIMGTVITLIILYFYKLNDHDVALMTKVNSGEMTREEAEAQMKRKYR